MNRIVVASSLILSLICIAFCVWLKMSMPKIAYVRSAVIVDGYSGMKEARIAYELKAQAWQSHIDTLTADYNKAFASYNTYQTTKKSNAYNHEKTQLENKRYTLDKYRLAIEEKAQQEEEKLTQGALNQINSFIENYAKNKGYTVVLGTTQAGNILYANDAVDITEEVLQGLNQNYK
jgi:outer membrane protein